MFIALCSCVVRYRELRADERLCSQNWHPLRLQKEKKNFFFEEKVYSYPRAEGRALAQESKRNKWREARREVPLPGSAPDSSKGAPTDPDAPVSGIRFLGFTVLRPVAIRHCRVNTFLNDSEFIPCFPVAVP